MIICDDFVFLHLHKSGGTFVNQLLLRCVPSARQIGYHLPYSKLPPEYQALAVLGTVRNPWAYYVSWFHFQKAQSRPNCLFMTCSDNGSLDFTQTIRNLVTLHGSEIRISKLVSALPDEFQTHGLNLTKRCVLKLQGSGLGFYSFLYGRHYTGATDLTVIDMDNLREGVARFLEERTSLATDLTRRFLSRAPAMNASEHAPYRSYYDADTRDLVARYDAHVIDRHGFKY